MNGVLGGVLCWNLLKAASAMIVVEELVALFWKERSFRLAVVVLAANVATNPALNLAFFFLADWIYVDSVRATFAIFIGETAVLGVETAIFGRWGRFLPKRAFFFALSLNVASYFSGSPLEKLGFWDW